MTQSSIHEALRREIAHRAYLRYCDRGCAPGGHLDDWLAAEREVLESARGESAPAEPGRSDGRRSRKARS